MKTRRWLPLAVCSICPVMLRAQGAPCCQTDFPPEEFKAQWTKVFDRLGDANVAIL
jgi:hypothetical protein